jgi:protein-S-isoprenylcysteine O-methyltransferase Ste14
LRLVFIPVICLFLFVAPSWTDDSTTDFAVEMSGYIFIMAGLTLRIWSTLYIGQRKSKHLIVEGSYSICRNPLYMGTVAIVFGAGLSLCNLPMTAFTVLVFVPVHVLVSRGEERHLGELFGQEYQEYRRTVPAFRFAFKNYRSSQEIMVSTRAIRRVALDASLIILILPLGEFVELLRNCKLLPVLWSFP